MDINQPTGARPVFLVDTREQTPWHFPGLPSWTGEPISQDQVKRATLATGDYSLQGLEDRIALERKSFDDLYGTLTFGRQRFLEEIDRAKCLDLFAVVVECRFEDLEHGHPRHQKFTGRSATRTVLSWQTRFPWVHWWFAGSRDRAALIGLRLLERYWMIAGDLKQSRKSGLG